MSKRLTGVGRSTKRKPHKTAKRLAAKVEMLARKALKRNK
jgi:hypothetical protein